MEVGQNISTYPKSKKHTYYFVPVVIYIIFKTFLKNQRLLNIPTINEEKSKYAHNF